MEEQGERAMKGFSVSVPAVALSTGLSRFQVGEYPQTRSKCSRTYMGPEKSRY